MSPMKTVPATNIGAVANTVHVQRLEFKYISSLGSKMDLPKAHEGNKINEDKEEERRLFYVASRAKEKCFCVLQTFALFFCCINTPSEFISDIL